MKTLPIFGVCIILCYCAGYFSASEVDFLNNQLTGYDKDFVSIQTKLSSKNDKINEQKQTIDRLETELLDTSEENYELKKETMRQEQILEELTDILREELEKDRMIRGVLGW